MRQHERLSIVVVIKAGEHRAEPAAQKEKIMDMKRAAEVAKGMLADAHAAYRSNNASWKDVKDQIALLDWLVDLTTDSDNEEVISQL